MKMNTTERLQWVMRMAFLLFILSSVAFLSALTAMRIAVQGREVAMPDVVGKSMVPARQILHGRGIGMKIEDRIYSEQPNDTIVRQSPPSNERVKTGQNAHVVLSLGPQRMTIPQLQDRSLRASGHKRIGAAARLNGTTYSKLINGLKTAGITLDRKVLAELAVNEPAAFAALVKATQK